MSDLRPSRSFRSLLVPVLGAFLVLAAASAASAADLVVGTYDPQQVAAAVGFQEKMMEQMQGLQSRAQQAQQTGDQAAMQQIQMEAQQIQQGAAQELIAQIEAAMPAVAEASGASVIAADVTWIAEGAEKVDVTAQLIEALGVESDEDDDSDDDGDSE